MTLTRGRSPKEVSFDGLRSLTRDELGLLVEKRNPTSVLQRFRDPHHRVARLIALGLRRQEVVEQSGYSYQRISTLEADPGFQELVATYRLDVNNQFRENADPFLEVATSNMLKAEVMLAEKIDDAMANGEFLPTRDLIAISRDAADRFGYGKKQTNLNVNVDFAAQLEKAIARSSKTLDLKPVVAVAGPRDVRSPTISPAQPQASPSPEPLRRRA